MKEFYMRKALELAKKGEGRVSPNPLVGCIVVKDGRILAEGYHEAYGGFHAERNALLSCREEVRGADLYVNLEPCCHQGKTPPCTELILEKGIRRVFIGCLDPNPLVAGKGAARLREGGILVETGILSEACQTLNEIFFCYITKKIPFVAMKYAMTLDGRIACDSGSSQWITGEAARSHVHQLRRKYRAIMAGIVTVMADDPMLDCRIEEGVNPIRIICDSALRLPPDSRIVKTADRIRTVVACRRDAAENPEKRKRLQQAGVEVWDIQPDSKNRLDLAALLKKMGQAGIDSVLAEGGGILHGALLEAGLVNRVYAYLAPKLVSGEENRAPIRGPGILRMSKAMALEKVETMAFGEDFLITGIRKKEQEGGGACLPES